MLVGVRFCFLRKNNVMMMMKAMRELYSTYVTNKSNDSSFLFSGKKGNDWEKKGREKYDDMTIQITCSWFYLQKGFALLPIFLEKH